MHHTRLVLAGLALAGIVALTGCQNDEKQQQANQRVHSNESTNTQKTPSLFNDWSDAGTLQAHADAASRYQLPSRLRYYNAEYYDDKKALFRVIDGDLHITGSLLLDWDLFDSYGLFVNGNLTVDGSIVNRKMNGGPFLLVGGTTQAHAIVGGGAQMVFEDQVQANEIVVGYYNDGILIFENSLTTPALVNMDHHIEVFGAFHGRWFDVFNGYDSWPMFMDPNLPEQALQEEDGWRWAEEVLFPMLTRRQGVLRSDLPEPAAHPKP